MKKSVYLWIIGIITGICVVIGLMCHVARYMIGMTGTTVETVAELEPFQSIEIESDIMDVKVEAGNGYEIRYCCGERDKLTYEVINGTLVVKQKNAKGVWPDREDADRNIQVVIPADVVLGEIEIDSDVGNVELERIYADKGDIESDIGDVVLRDCDFNNLNVVSDIGNVEAAFAGEHSEYTLDLASDIGGIISKGQDVKNHYYSDGSTDKVIKIISDIGDIELF